MSDDSVRVDPATLRLQGAPNFRAVGALPAADQRRLSPGWIWRSDALHRLDDADLAQLERLSIRTVIDLRREDERRLMPTRWPQGQTRTTRVFDEAPDALQVVQAGGWRMALETPDFDAQAARGWMLETYRRMPAALAPAVRDAAHALVTSVTIPQSVLVHCTAGKDRTGFVIALLLCALDVPWEAILEDYLETTRRTPPEWLAEALIGKLGLADNTRVRGAVETIAGVEADYLEAARQTLLVQHPSTAAYLDAIGVDATVRAALQAALLD